MEDTSNIVKRSIRELAGHCDGASTLDGQGFSRLDAGFGHSLANNAGEWTDKQLKAGCKLVIKYQGQLPQADIEKVKELMDSLETEIIKKDKKIKEEKKSSMKVSLLTDREGNKKLAITFAYDKYIVEKIKTLEGRRWNQQNKRWELPLATLDNVKKAFPNAEISDGLNKIKEQQKEKDKLISKEFREITSEMDLTKPLKNGKTPFKHQKEGILRMLKYRRQILADDMGLGKTLQALVVAKELTQYYGWTIIIICPVSLKENWEREAKSLGISKMQFSVHSWAKIPEAPPKNYIVIADEAHYAQAGTKTLRGKALLNLSANDHCKACYLLTGTPIKNGRPINIFPLLKAVKHPLGDQSGYFQKRYCAAHHRFMGKRRFWDNSGSSHLDELHNKIKDIMIRRTKKECLDLPDKLRVLREAELSKAAIKLYNDTLNNLRETYQKRLKSGEIEAGGEAMIMLGHLAHAGALGKVETAYELGSEVLEEGNQVVIFSTYREPLQQLEKKFKDNDIPTALLMGDTKTKDRQKLVDEFQAGKIKVFLLSMAGGVGIDLFKAQTIILINRAWTPGDTVQIEDRLHRIGQVNPVTSIWLQHGEVDKHVDAILESKSMNIQQVLQSKNKEDDIITFAKKFFKGN